MHHPLLVVKSFAFPLFINTDILYAHGAIVTLDETAPVRLRNRKYSIFCEQRTNLLAALPLAPLTAFAACSAVI